MDQKIKKFFSVYSKQGKFFLILFFVILILVLPLYSLAQSFWEDVWNIVTITLMFNPATLGLTQAGIIESAGVNLVKSTIANFLQALVVTILVLVPLTITNAFLSLSTSLLAIATSPSFIDLSYTNPEGNLILQRGLDLTKDLANIFIVLGLVVIGLATILRIEGYQAKKTLPLLIGVALLVNFAPVICGLVVDASNILMYHLIGNFVDFTPVKTAFEKQLTLIDSAWKAVLKGTIDFKPLGETIALIFFGAIAGIVFSIYAALFVFRYIAIWILVILSPLAFVCYILPYSRDIFKMWWQQFVQWCFVGVVAGFFLYLGHHALGLAQSGELVNILAPAPDEPAAGMKGLLNTILPYGVVIGFLLMSLSAIYSINAMGTQKIIGLTRRSGRWIGGQTWQGTKRWVEEKVPVREAAGKITRGLEAIPMARAFIPQKLREYAEYGEAIKDQGPSITPLSSPAIGGSIAAGAFYGTKAVRGIAELVDRGDMQDFFNPFMKKYNVKNEEELFTKEEFRKKAGRYLQIALQGGYHNALLRGDPRLARVAPGIIPGYEGLTEEKAVAKATAEARRQHIAKWERDVLEDSYVVEYKMEEGKEIWDAILGVKRGQQTSLKSIDSLFSQFIDEAKISPPKTNKEKTEAWTKYREYFKKKHSDREGYFRVADDPRGKVQGWRIGEYIAKEERFKKEREMKKKPTEAESVTVEKAMGIEIDTGEAGAKKRKKPDVGEP